jgi:hypothetical protein
MPALHARHGTVAAATFTQRVRARWSTGRSVNVEHGLAADAAVQQGVDRRLRLAP